MRALTVEPGVAGSASLDDRPAPVPGDGQVEVETLLVGVCGTDREIVAGDYGEPPPGATRLVIGHEALARVVAAPEGSGLATSDLVVPFVRRPDPVPCPSCAVGEWDMCRNGRYTEHGIKGIDGFAAERTVLDPGAVVPVPPALGDLGVLVEPASVVAKAWEHIEHIGRRAHWRPRSVLVTGAGPVGLLAALLARQRDLEVHVLDIVTDGPKPDLVADLGAEYHVGPLAEAGPSPDVIVECTGMGVLVLDAIRHSGQAGIVCLAGLSSGARTVEISPAELNRRLVLENDVVFGSVNANRRHYEAAVAALAQADVAWLGRLVNRRLPLERWADALAHQADDVKAVIEIGA